MAGPQYAGQYGPEGFTLSSGRPARNEPITVITVTGELATLYSGKEKQGIVANPTTTDPLGNLTFWVVPGEYALMIENEIYPILVHLHPEDPGVISKQENPVVDWFHDFGEPTKDGRVVTGAEVGDMYRDDENGNLWQLR